PPIVTHSVTSSSATNGSSTGQSDSPSPAKPTELCSYSYQSSCGVCEIETRTKHFPVAASSWVIWPWTTTWRPMWSSGALTIRASSRSSSSSYVLRSGATLGAGAGAAAREDHGAHQRDRHRHRGDHSERRGGRSRIEALGRKSATCGEEDQDDADETERGSEQRHPAQQESGRADDEGAECERRSGRRRPSGIMHLAGKVRGAAGRRAAARAVGRHRHLVTCTAVCGASFR